MAPPLSEDVLGTFVHLNQKVARAIELLYPGNDEVSSESLLEQVRSCSSKVERVFAMSKDPQILEEDTPTNKCSIMASIAAGMNIYQPDSILNDGRGRAVFTHIILLAEDEDSTKLLIYQAAMNNNWVRFPCKVLCEKFPVILSLLDESLLPRANSKKPLVYDPQIINPNKSSYHYVGVYFTRFMHSRFARKQDGCDKVKDLNDWEAFRVVKRIEYFEDF